MVEDVAVNPGQKQNADAGDDAAVSGFSPGDVAMTDQGSGAIEEH